MNSDNTNLIKKVLEEAAGINSQNVNAGWEAGGIERLFISDQSGQTIGCVEVRHSEKNSEHVRIELDISPDIAARVLALVTGTPLGDLPVLTEAEDLAIAECVRPAIPDGFIKIEKNPSLDIDPRNEEIKRLLKEQRADDEDEEKPSSDDPTELDFNMPEERERA